MPDSQRPPVELPPPTPECDPHHRESDGRRKSDKIVAWWNKHGYLALLAASCIPSVFVGYLWATNSIQDLVTEQAERYEKRLEAAEKRFDETSAYFRAILTERNKQLVDIRADKDSQLAEKDKQIGTLQGQLYDLGQQALGRVGDAAQKAATATQQAADALRRQPSGDGVK